MMEQYGYEEAVSVVDELGNLMQAGQLFSDDHELEGFTPHTEPIVKAICLHMAHDCNLRCGYCFADSGAYHGQRSLMSLETGKKALDFLIKASKHRKHIEVDFFGGEPLLNFDVCKQLVAYGKEQGKLHDKIFKFTLTTNGVLLTKEVQDFLNQEGISAVLSLDGRKETNDNMRKFPNGAGSYDAIVQNFQDFVKTRNGQEYYLRGTYTHHNTDFAADVAHMVDLGFRELSMEPVVAPTEFDYALTDEDVFAACREYDKLARHYLACYQKGDPYNFFHFNVDLAQGPCVIKRLRGCGAGCEYVAITPEGDIYPCHQFVGNEDYKLGSLYDGTFDKELSGRFAGLNIYTREECRDCWARFYCSGGCSASNLLVNGDIKKPHRVGCELERKRLECAIALRAIAAGMAD